MKADYVFCDVRTAAYERVVDGNIALCETQTEDWETTDDLNISAFARQVREI